MKINGNQVAPGNVIQHNDSLWVAVKTQHVKPGKGGAFAQVELKNVFNGSKLNERFRSSETVEKVRLEQKNFQYLFESGGMLTFMDLENYEQIELERDFVGDRASFLQEGMAVRLESYEGRPIAVEFPEYVTLEVTETEPSIKGQTASSSYKPAVLENGLRTMVPPFVTVGEKIVVATEDSSYVRRTD
jgi:elongation factor P